MFPYLDIPGLKLRSSMTDEDIDVLEAKYPGYLGQQTEVFSSLINTRARKRYGNTVQQAAVIPFGQSPAPLLGIGTAPPGITLAGRPTLGSMQLLVTITTPGPLGTAIFSWSSNKGKTTIPGVVTGPSVVLPGTGLTATFSLGTYSADNVYGARTPVPETVLGWLATLVTFRAYRKRGANFSDPDLGTLKEEVQQVFADLQELADSKDGRFELPPSEDVATSAVSTGGPQSYTENSPFVSADLQQFYGLQDDCNVAQMIAFLPFGSW